ncbi:Crp/Fnr family transcriptional regulator [Desulfovermiculus halophilus]|jgi:CRP-like cAMP-binding protein|uniref:Crp/Fnr family transcriptional regulator n=1 Tax=Desulfovermiculus halophilus TaxID=339722 RepID=UPI000483983D|nr:cyclic nucleotide-binding domain-containing protein [Desulfovermiculus halophilus]
MVSLETLKSLELFHDLSTEQLESLQEQAYTEHFTRNTCLFKEGDPARELWIETEGQVDLRFELPGQTITSNDQTIQHIEARPLEARMLGWSCFVPPYQMRLSAYCVTETCTVIKFKRDALLELFEHDTDMGYKILSFMIKVVGYRFHECQDELAKHMGENIINAW